MAPNAIEDAKLYPKILMSHLIPIGTSTPDFLAAPITDAEAEAMFRACLNLFRLWKISDTEAAILLDLPPRTFARWKTGTVGRIGRDQKARLSNLMGIHKALRLIFREPERCYAWPRLPNDAFDGCSALSSVLATGIADEVSFANCNMNAAALNVLFTNLGTVVGKTITITGNPGAATCNTAIATGKGWSVTV